MTARIIYDNVDAAADLRRIERIVALFSEKLWDEVANQAQNLRNEALEAGSVIDENDFEILCEEYRSDAERLKQHLVRAAVVMAYAAFEKALLEIAMLFHIIKKSDRPKKKENSAFLRAIDALENCGITNFKTKIEWERANTIRHVRNCLAHDAALRDGQQEKLEVSAWNLNMPGLSVLEVDSLLQDVWELRLEPYLAGWSCLVLEKCLAFIVLEINQSHKISSAAP